MKYLTMLFFPLLLACHSRSTSSINNTNQTTFPFYVGTYTQGESEGIYAYELSSNGDLSYKSLAAKAIQPSFLAWSHNREYVLAVNEVNEENEGYVSLFQPRGDTLLLKDKVKSGGAHPCFITTNAKNKVLVANYTGGNVSLLKLKSPEGQLEKLSIQQHTGSGHHKRQDKPHAHSAYFLTDSTVVSADLGTNELWFSTIKHHSLTIDKEPYELPKGAGPRLIAIHSNHHWMYVLNELNNTISFLQKDTNQWVQEQVVDLVPSTYQKESHAAHIQLSNDGKFLYASNRGHNSIAIFSVEPKGTLQLKGFQSTNGQTPRHFAISPDNRFLIVANQDTNTLISFQRDEQTGLLNYRSEIQAPSPVCILF